MRICSCHCRWRRIIPFVGGRCSFYICWDTLCYRVSNFLCFTINTLCVWPIVSSSICSSTSLKRLSRVSWSRSDVRFPLLVTSVWPDWWSTNVSSTCASSIWFYRRSSIIICRISWGASTTTNGSICCWWLPGKTRWLFSFNRVSLSWSFKSSMCASRIKRVI